MSVNNNSLVRHGNNDSDSDQTVDSEDDTGAIGSPVPPVILPSAVTSLSEAMAANRIEMKDCQRITIGTKNYFTINCDTKSGENSKQQRNQPIRDSNPTELAYIDSERPFKFVSRGKWLAKPPKNPPTKLQLPATKVIIAHTGTDNVSTEEACLNRVKGFQEFHMGARGWDDIAYNFMIGGNSVYEGCGWDRQGSHTQGYNDRSICIAFIGTFIEVKPPEHQLIVAQKLIDEGVKLRKLAPDYRLFGHLQLRSTESPGRELYKIIVDWPHWSEDIHSE